MSVGVWAHCGYLPQRGWPRAQSQGEDHRVRIRQAGDKACLPVQTGDPRRGAQVMYITVIVHCVDG